MVPHNGRQTRSCDTLAHAIYIGSHKLQVSIDAAWGAEEADRFPTPSIAPRCQSLDSLPCTQYFRPSRPFPQRVYV